LSAGFGFFASKAAADIICPAWQLAALRHIDILPGDLYGVGAIWRKPFEGGDCLGPTAETGVIQERTGWPPRWTVQAPHWPMRSRISYRQD